MRVSTTIVIALAWMAIGCGRRGPRPDEPLMPEPAAARRALEGSLRSWVDGKPASPSLDGIRVEHVDRNRAEGRRPTAYEIAGAVREDWARGFVVRLTWPDRADPETFTYMVAGLDPIWILRRDEIELLMHWEHPMDPPAPESVEPESTTHHPEGPGPS